MAKAPANYAKLADDTELTVLGLEAKVAQIKRHMNTLLKDVPERAAIVQAAERMGSWAYQLTEARMRFDRYVALRDRPAGDESGDTPAS